ncbi:MAG: FAD-binding protein [Kofleriaceae bacterium]
MRLLAIAALAACSSTPKAPAPEAVDWNELRAHVSKLVQPGAPIATDNPFAREDDVSGTQSAGWIDAWQPATSAYAVVAHNARDVSEAVQFAAAHHQKLVVKGTGHDYLGRSTAPNSLMVWTHEMRDIDVIAAFVPHGCQTAPVQAVSLGAGVRWLEAYHAVSIDSHRYVQGGGCTSVGAAGGFLQGGGFGSYSKNFGVAAASLLEAEVVTADGQIRIANACSEPDLYWALRGGGGGTFGIVTRVTLATYDLPATFGIVAGKIAAKTDAAYRRLATHFLAFYRDKLNNEHWGEKITLDPNNEFELSLTSQGLSQAESDALWQPFKDWVASDSELSGGFVVRVFPGAVMWNTDILKKFAPEAIKLDDKNPALYWWAGDAEQVGAYWFAYISRWLPETAFAGDKLAGTLFEASRKWHVELHFNKGLAGGSAAALARTKETAVNPEVLGASALLIAGAFTTKNPPDKVEGARQRQGVTDAVNLIDAAMPNLGSYVNEGDYFEKDWQRRFWGTNYDRLLKIKKQYDPKNLFTCHHCVGSE